MRRWIATYFADDVVREKVTVMRAQAAVQDADEAVAQGAQGLVVAHHTRYDEHTAWAHRTPVAA